MTDISWENNLAKAARAKSSVHALLALYDNDKRALLKEINKSCETNYKINHLDNWLSDRVVTPVTVRGICRIKVLHRCLPMDLVDKLWRCF